MALVGEIILGAREIFTDLCASMNEPQDVTITPITVGGLPPFPAATYYFSATYLNQFGETLGSDEQAIVLAGPNNTFQVSIFGVIGATKCRVYIGRSADAEDVYQEFTLTSGAVTQFNLGLYTQSIPGRLPSRSTAYLPDTDGGALSAAAIYRWINDGLNTASTICDGLPDFAAVGTTVGQPAYVFPGTWNKVALAWYDGYPIPVDSKNNVFRRTNVPGIVGNLSLIQSTDRVIVECWPQPSRTSGQTTLSADLSASASVASLAASNFVLGFGLAQIGEELVYYAKNASGQLQGLTRGMAGTIPTAWPSGTAVTELNLMVTGTRAPRPYSLGSAMSTFYLPPGWEDAIITYLVSRFRKGEQLTQESQALLNEFTAKVQKLTATKIIAGPRQIPGYGRGSGTEVAVGLGTQFGGVIVP